MGYYDEMRTKYGFQDGEMVPPDAWAARRVLVEAINAYLGPDSPVEAYEYDRPGVHNWCLILYRDKRTGKDVSEPDGVEEFVRDFQEEVLPACYSVRIELLADYQETVRDFIRAYRGEGCNAQEEVSP